MNTLRRLVLASLLVAPLASLSACGGSATFSSTDAEIAADSTDTADVVSGLTSVSSDGVDVQASGFDQRQRRHCRRRRRCRGEVRPAGLSRPRTSLATSRPTR